MYVYKLRIPKHIFCNKKEWDFPFFKQQLTFSKNSFLTYIFPYLSHSIVIVEILAKSGPSTMHTKNIRYLLYKLGTVLHPRAWILKITPWKIYMALWKKLSNSSQADCNKEILCSSLHNLSILNPELHLLCTYLKVLLSLCKFTYLVCIFSCNLCNSLIDLFWTVSLKLLENCYFLW